jgi:AbiV family abortive infection protein
MRRLTYEQMAAVSLASLANARRLYEDATRLGDFGSHATAYCVAGLAVDELGKHIMTASFFGGRDASESDWRTFWKRFRRHQDKLGNGLLFGWMGDLLSDDAPPDVEQFHQSRLDATYVEVDQRGNVREPREVVSRQQLRVMLERLQRELSFCEGLFKDISAERLGEALRAAHEPEARSVARALRDEMGPTASLSLLLALRHGLAPSTALDVAARVANTRDAASQPDTAPGP